MVRRWLPALLLSAVLVTQRSAAEEPRLPRLAPLAPAAAAATIQTRQGFRMDLLAAEPLVTDPVAIEYDEHGRAFVVEMCDYPYTDKATDKPFVERTTDLPLGRLRVLEDTNGDGRFDTSVIFADRLSWPTGLAFWGRGVFVAATPDVWYFEDTDGDLRADIRRQVFSGFRKFNVQAVMNNLKWGLDQRIYGAGSSNGGTIRLLSHPNDKPSLLGRNDFRFDPRDERLELIAGGARFGNTFDDWGQRFLCNIRNPLQHVVLPSHYLARNPYLAVRSSLHDAAAAGDTLPIFRISPVEPWRKLRAERWAAESGQTYPRSETNATGYFTSSSGVTIYRGAAYPKEFYGNAFLGEVAANAVHRLVVAPDGVTFRARRADEGAEFVASTDNWFRPVNFVNAPDGTLHVLDMYRETIEHPWSIPDDIKEQLDLESGRDRGRIYRLTPPNFTVPPQPQLGKASTEELVQTLQNPNSWWRETAHRLLFQRQDTAAVGPLRKLLKSSEHDTARLHALWSLAGLERLSDDDLRIALDDASPGVREHAVLLAEPRMNKETADARGLLDVVLRRADDPAIRVRFQVALSLGVIPSAAAEAALVAIARRDGADPWMQAAILSSCADRSGKLAATLWRQPEWQTTSENIGLLRTIATIVGARHDETEVTQFLDLLATAPLCRRADELDLFSVRAELLAGLGTGLQRGGRELARYWKDKGGPREAFVVQQLQLARRSVLDAVQPVEVRLRALQLLALDDFHSTGNIWGPLLSAQEPPAIQLAALRAMASFSSPAVADRLLAVYPGLTPVLRAEVVEALAARPDRHAVLLRALEERVISTKQIPAARRTQLLSHSSAELRARAERLFAVDAPGPRREVLERYRPALRLTADAMRGRTVFARECAACHRLQGQGFDVGPNLETVKNRTADELLTNVLDPNREVSPNYLEYLVTLQDGRILSGIVVNETATSVELRRAQGVQDTILRGDIERMVGLGKSLMPEGLEQKLSEQELADLIAYILQRS